MNWAETKHCLAGAHCRTCRSRGPAGAVWRQTMAKDFTPPPHWECPHGIPWDIGATHLQRLLRRLRLGDKVERATRKVGIKPCLGCTKRKATLNGEPPAP